MPFGGIGGVGVSGLYWGLAGTVHTQGPEGYRDIWGVLGAPIGCRGLFWGIRGHWGVRGL